LAEAFAAKPVRPSELAAMSTRKVADVLRLTDFMIFHSCRLAWPDTASHEARLDQVPVSRPRVRAGGFAGQPG